MAISPSASSRKSDLFDPTSFTSALEVLQGIENTAQDPSCKMISSLIKIIKENNGFSEDNFISLDNSKSLEKRTIRWGITPAFDLYVIFEYVVCINSKFFLSQQTTFKVPSTSLKKDIVIIKDVGNYPIWRKNLNALETLLKGCALSYTSIDVDSEKIVKYSFSLDSNK